MAKILIVDDEVNVLKLYSEELEKEGHQTSVAKNIEEALEITEEDPPDLIVLDIKLGEESGIDYLTETVKKHKNIPVILNSAYSVYKDNFKTWAADAYIIKSLDLDPLKKKINELLEKKSVRGE